jgi:hypothetical protein
MALTREAAAVLSHAELLDLVVRQSGQSTSHGRVHR